MVKFFKTLTLPILALFISINAEADVTAVETEQQGDKIKVTLQSGGEVKKLNKALGNCEKGQYNFVMNIAGQEVNTKHKIDDLTTSKGECYYKSVYPCGEKSCGTECNYPKDILDIFVKRSKDPESVEILVDPQSPKDYELVNKLDRKINKLNKKYCNEFRN